MIGSAESEASSRFIPSESIYPSPEYEAVLTSPACSPRLLYAPPYPAIGGYRREEAIMLLRRFYISENVTGESARLSSACE